jgi:hypothetical protein
MAAPMMVDVSSFSFIMTSPQRARRTLRVSFFCGYARGCSMSSYSGGSICDVHLVSSSSSLSHGCRSALRRDAETAPRALLY